MTDKNRFEDVIPESHGVIEMHLDDLNKLFDTMDPSPLCEKNLHPNVADRIVDSAKEFPARAPLALILHVDQSDSTGQEDHVVGNATRAYFTHLSKQSKRKLRLHLRRGAISLMIGLAFLATTLAGAQLLGESSLAKMFRESLIIGGWVALWRPMEMFLYDWWPLLGERIFYKRLGCMPVKIKYSTPPWTYC
ncbi:hypothetical protein ACTPOE_09620 [Castellaniella sp. WN]